MSSWTDQLNSLLSALTLVAHVAIAVALLYFLYRKATKKKISPIEDVFSFVHRNAVALSLLVSASGVALSLIYSEVIGYVPCELCWYQRIFLYPLAVLFAVALVKKETRYVVMYTLPLAVIGFAIAAYHYALQMISRYVTVPDVFTPCSLDGFTPSCTSYDFLSFGYITLPLMSLTAFGVLLMLYAISRARQGATV